MAARIAPPTLRRSRIQGSYRGSRSWPRGYANRDGTPSERLRHSRASRVDRHPGESFIQGTPEGLDEE